MNEPKMKYLLVCVMKNGDIKHIFESRPLPIKKALVKILRNDIDLNDKLKEAKSDEETNKVMKQISKGIILFDLEKCKPIKYKTEIEFEPVVNIKF